MTELQIANILQATVVVALWSFVIFKLLPTYRIDSFRQRLFCVRDEMFDFAADGNIAFDDPAYMLLRRQMNGLIRNGHQLTLFRSLMTIAIQRISGTQTTSWNQAWEASLENLQSEDVRAKMKKFHERGMMITASYLILGSPALWVVFLIAALCIFAQGATMGIKQLIKAASKKVLSGPLDQRFIEEAAVGTFA